MSKTERDQASVLQRSLAEQPVLDGAGLMQRRFRRLRRDTAPPTTEINGSATPHRPPPVLHASDAPSPPIGPVDQAKTFVGPNGIYYDERWRWMEWRGRNCSWNWSAALTFGGWFAYRRFYWLAALYLGWVGLLLQALMRGASLRSVAVAQLVVAMVVGSYANRLYQQRFRRAAWRVAQDHQDHAMRLRALARLGGIDRRAVWFMVLAGIGLTGLLIGLGD
jgi:hypothetical protein